MILTKLLLGFLLILPSCQILFGLQQGGTRTVHVDNIIRRPPDTTQRNGGGGENGYRLLTSKECRSISQLWQKGLGVLDSNMKIELYEMIRIIERGSDMMPGKEPQRKELVAFGEFQDGVIVCVCMGYLEKCKCPWDLHVVTLAHLLQDPQLEENMVDFIKDVCLEHACVPDYSYLEKWDSFANKKWIKSPRKLAEEKIIEREHSISALYSRCNKAPAVVLDNHGVEYLGPYWYKFRIPNTLLPENKRATLYFRQKSAALRDEFEIRFFPPVTGVSSGRGTVGAAIIIDTDNNESFAKYKCSNLVIGNVKVVSEEILSRVNHPEEFYTLLDAAEGTTTTNNQMSTDLSTDYLTGREMIKKLRDDYRRDNNAKNGN